MSTAVDFWTNRWVQGIALPKFPRFSLLLARSSAWVTVLASAPFLTPVPSISASELPPQHHEVEFSLTHKINFLILPTQKRKFLSTQQHGLPLADSIILASARKFDATLWTQDSDFMHIGGVKYFPKKK